METKPKVRNFRDLIVWQRSMELSVQIYKITKQFPRDEIYGLTSQIRRAAVSIPSNIAEGQARGTDAAFANHVDIALGSTAELETQLNIASQVGYLDKSDLENIIKMIEEITKMLYGLLNHLRKSKR